ncbi:Alpha/beta hydrolase fold-1 [Phaeosphaeriaceae sp. PMI808]|nr:Alpha/beta hydrolase fold-1 [Phaeosphaeriaceae sp. PMI808]
MDLVSRKLEDAGYKIFARDMPAVGSTSPSKDLTEDIAALRSLVEQAIGDGNNVIPIVHSWGGIVACTGLSGLGKKERAAEGKKGGIVRVGYMAAFIVPEGTSLMDAIGGADPEWFNIQGELLYATDASIFYNDLPEKEQQDWFSKLQSQTLATFHTKTTAATWRQIPTSYLVCEDDRAIPAFAQDAMIKAVQDAGAEIDVTRFKASHSPFLSMPEETAGWIRRVAGEKV